MAISIDWSTKIVYVPQADLVHLGGVVYQLNVEWFRNALKDIEDSEEGVVQPVTHRRNAPVQLSGVVYAQTFELINGYTVSFENTGVPYTVNVTGGNHNLGDVTNFDGGMSMIIGNSGGLVVVDGAGGGTSYTPQQVADAVAAHDKTLTVPKFLALKN